MVTGEGLYDLIDIQRDAADDGAELPSYVTLMANVPCKVEALGGREALKGEQIKAEATYRITLQYYDEITIRPNMRVVLREGQDPVGTLYNIVAVIHERPLGLDQLTKLMCEEFADAT